MVDVPVIDEKPEIIDESLTKEEPEVSEEPVLKEGLEVVAVTTFSWSAHSGVKTNIPED